jgi:MFS family permease
MAQSEGVSQGTAESDVGKLVVLMITAFVDMVGLLMVLPLLPFYTLELGGSGLVVGLLVSSFSVAQLASAPVWGRFSDKHGRRPALLIGLGAASIAYVVFAFSNSLWMLFASRLVQGAGGGTVGVIQAYVADATKPQQRARSLGWLSAATNLGVTIGPVLGSFSLLLGRPAPGLIAAGLCLLNMLFAWRYLRESHDIAAASQTPAKSPRGAVMRVITHSAEPAPRLIWIYAIGMGAFTGMTSILALFLHLRFSVDERSIGYFFMYIGAISVVTRAGVLGWMVDTYGEPRLSRLGQLLLAAGLVSIPFTHSIWQLAIAVAMVPLGTAFTFPCVTAMLSRVIGSHERGLYMGVQQTFGGVARVIAPVWAGYAFDTLGVAVPFITSAALVLGTIFLGLGLEGYMKPKAEPAKGTA